MTTQPPPTKPKSLGSRMSVLRAAVALVYRASPREFVVMVVLQATAALAAIAAVVAGGLLAERLVGLSSNEPTNGLGAPLAGFLVATLVALSSTAISSERRRVLGELTQRLAVDDVLSSVVASELPRFDDPAFHDRMMRAYASAGSRPLAVVTGLIGMVSSVVTVVGLTVTLLLISPLVLVVVLVAFVPLAWTARTSTRVFYEFSKAETQRDRQRSYLISALMVRQLAGEVRTYQLGEPLRERIRVLHDERIGRLRVLVRKRIVLGLGSVAISVGIAGVVLWVLAGEVADGNLGLDQAAVATGALLVMAQRLQTLISSASSIFESALFLEDVASFAADTTPPPVVSASEPITNLELRGVSFTYPAGTEPAVRDVDLSLNTGRLVALVGENGSGKTTLARIIAHLYQPDGGERLVNGVVDADGRHRRDRIAVVHQDFIRFMLSVADNIGMGRLEDRDDVGRIADAARFGGIDEAIERLRHGLDTVLGTEYTEGQEFSGGQWQRLAIARAWFRNADVVVFDEPTSALDPKAEVDLVDKIRLLAHDKLVVLISHRFGTVSKADEIVVMHEGRIVEQGSHPELMDLDGVYATMYSMQAETFR
jgi:ATP-binding cassette, subfamily B, bacterial